MPLSVFKRISKTNMGVKESPSILTIPKKNKKVKKNRYKSFLRKAAMATFIATQTPGRIKANHL